MSKRLQRRQRQSRDRMPKRQVAWGGGAGLVLCEKCRLFVLPCQCCNPPVAAHFCPNCDGPVVSL